MLGDTPVHPHACGERELPASRLARLFGSSPRMWGTGKSVLPRNSRPRFIPTHVGNGPEPPLDCGGITVHPHACGERLFGAQLNKYQIGSSPRMWGTAPGGERLAVPSRFIPTHVGNGSISFSASLLLPVHPHACGERKLLAQRRAGIVGSSPRMWGTGQLINAR